MSGWRGSNWDWVAAYAVAAAAALLAARREQGRARLEADVWPTFWLITAGLFLMVVFARATDLGRVVTQLGRGEALSHGWYSHRRKFQALVIGAIGATGVTAVVVALFRVPARCRRYLPAAIVVFSLMCFAGIRLVSLHQVDALLYRRSVAGVDVGSALELMGVAIFVALTFWQPRPQLVAHPEVPVAVDSRRGPA